VPPMYFPVSWCRREDYQRIRAMMDDVDNFPEMFDECVLIVTSRPPQEWPFVACNDDRLVSQLVGLERRTSRTGKGSVDHMRGMHDDIANAVAGALVCAETAGDTNFSRRLVYPQLGVV
jgi:hypothetical protein